MELLTQRGSIRGIDQREDGLVQFESGDPGGGALCVNLSTPHYSVTVTIWGHLVVKEIEQ